MELWILLLVFTTITVDASGLISYIFGSSKNDSDGKNKVEKIVASIHRYEQSYLRLPHHPMDSKWLGLSKNHMEEISRGILCSLYSDHSAETMCHGMRKHGSNGYLYSLKVSEVIVLIFKPMIPLKGHIDLVEHIFERAEQLAPRVSRVLQRTKAKEIVFAGRGSGGAIASLSAWKVANRKISVVSVDEEKVYSSIMKSKYPIPPNRYIHFTTELGRMSSHNQQVAALSKNYPNFLNNECHEIKLGLLGLDVYNGPEIDEVFLQAYSPKHIKHVDRDKILSFKNQVLATIQFQHSIHSTLADTYAIKKLDLINHEPINIAKALKADLSNVFSKKIVCNVRELKRKSFVITCTLDEKGSKMPVIEYLAKKGNAEHEDSNIDWLISHAIPYEDEDSEYALKEPRFLKCFKELFSDNKVLRYILPQRENCHFYYFGAANKDYEGAWVIPLGSMQLLAQFFDSAPSFFYSLLPIKDMNMPHSCRGILNPVQSKRDWLLDQLRNITSEYVMAKTMNKNIQDFSLFSPKHIAPGFDTIRMETNLSSSRTYYLPERYYFRLSFCLTSELVSSIDCTNPINRWLGKCPQYCENSEVADFCKRVISCNSANMYISISPTGLVYGLDEVMKRLRVEVESPLLFSLIKFRSKDKGYGRLGIFKEIYVVFQQMEGTYTDNTSSSSSGGEENIFETHSASQSLRIERKHGKALQKSRFHPKRKS